MLLTTGVVTSPNYPNNYPNYLQRTETIQIGEGLILSLEFNAFNIQGDSWDCRDRDDHLTITDGDGTTLMDKSCGSSLPAAITSISNTVKIMFSTDSYRTESGWSLNWTAVTPGE